ncbi:MAG: hypothetical protein IPI33_01690 [Dehalococcoidia bacterium]|uniref:hypothetical protein n=1 Tax=Candidatus Amarobacter glycogenicus TaxID=3140699 RepID=UPI001D667ACB|nr:hypothetical protein [Dehalococcoidia bacterium]MBK6562505.1 hypothetical protein [Dehalococcoidia bacterium]MBK7723989.1 hypothetical protein [Dehalococcoidia bacterium]MBK8560692.1 hypothetical protein [Dehalococcoidia bacterium]MBK9544625.1 hypothetical protein [Dehalococcoidia bacterium]
MADHPNEVHPWQRRAWQIAAVAEGSVLAGLVVAGILLVATTGRSRPEAAANEPSEVSVVRLGPNTQLPLAINYYIVDSEETASDLRLALALGNNVRYSVGLSPMRDEVIVVADAEEALFVAECLEEGNRILASFNTVDRVINLAT